MSKLKIALFPGSFDPFHQGHLTVIEQAVPLFDKIYVVITNNINKPQQKDVKQLLPSVVSAVKQWLNVQVITNPKPILTSVLANKYHAEYLIRGIRNNDDANYEQELAIANHLMNPQLITVCFYNYNVDQKLSSSLLREISKLKKST